MLSSFVRVEALCTILYIQKPQVTLLFFFSTYAHLHPTVLCHAVLCCVLCPQAEFVTTTEYEPNKAKDSSSSSWGSWFSSSAASKSSGKSAAAASADDSDNDADADVVVDDDQRGPGTFKPLLPFYKNPYCLDRHQQLLCAAGWA